MKADYILKADILDIIFERKNKDYGAYTLRKFYHQRLYKSLGAIFLVTLILGLFGYFYKNKTGVNIFQIPDPEGAVLYEMPVDAPKPPEPPRPPKTLSMPLASNIDLNPVVVEDDLAKPIDILHDEGDIVDNPVGEGTDTPAGNGPAGTGDPKSTVTSTVIPEPVKPIDKTIPVAAEVQPSYPGGIEALRKFLKKNLVTPKDLDPDETVSVTVQFIVGYDGSLKGFKITEDGGAIFNEEVIRVLKKMPEWIPGKAHGENVSVYYSIPVKFMAEDK
ncbi:MAG: energy transducer TonB [Ferruginibacter sp.]